MQNAKGFTPRYRTKNQIARLLLYRLHKLPIFAVTRELVCDNWYASKQNLRFFEKLGFCVVTRLRKNAWVVLDQERLKLKTLAQREPIAHYHYYQELGAYVKSYIICYPKVGFVKVAVVKHDRHAEPGRTKFIIATELSVSNRELVLRYRHRWIIEEFFRDVKQRFGLADCQAREDAPLFFHFQMVFLASVLCDLITDCRPSSQTMGDVIASLRSLKVLRLAGGSAELIRIHPSGVVETVCWSSFLEPIQTKLSLEIGAEIPADIYNLYISASS